MKTGQRDAQFATLVKALHSPPRWMTVYTQDSQRKDPPEERQGKVAKAPSMDPPEGHPEDTEGHMSKRDGRFSVVTVGEDSPPPRGETTVT